MSKFMKKDLKNPEFADHKRFCQSCRRETFRWTCCGKRTSQAKMQPNPNQYHSDSVPLR